ncbi:uncharacterized protein [Drosophila tropicalis]|uniref:uncharacterized protein n=1 Tax=Drosophila tropicalis TaxID=46794 RepID=UPI0035ABA7EA
MASSSSSSSSYSSTAYALFLHREELRRRQRQYARVSKTKIQLTSELISLIKQRLTTCSYEDLQILNREKQFKRDLQQQLKHRYKQLKAIAKGKKQVKRLHSSASS